MHSVIMKITHSLAIKDTIAIARGLYKVLDATLKSQNPVSITNSWHYQDNSLLQEKKSVQHHKDQKQSEKTITKHNQALIINKGLSQKIIGQDSQNKVQTIRQNKFEHAQMQIKEAQKQKNQPVKKDYRLDLIQQEQPQTSQFNRVQSKVPSSRISRFFQFGKLGVSLAESAVQIYFSKNKGTDQNILYEKMANKISEELCKMRGAPLKLAQMLSIQQDKLIPAPIRRAFQKARETAHILPLQEKNLGKQWRTIFSQFNQKPFASASIGQVHRGKIGDKQLAIKIQYPGVRQSVQSDINNLSFLMKIPKVFPKGMFMQKILKKTKEQLLEQCDYLLQKTKQIKYKKCLQISLKNEKLLYKVPEVLEDLTTKQIFISQYLSGVSMKKIEQGHYSQQLRDQIGRRILKITFRQLFQMGIVQSDPNPSNFTYNVQKDQLNLFDFGATHIYRQQFLKEYYKIIRGSVQSNEKQIHQASIATGFLTGEESQMMKNSHIKSILITGQPLRHKGIYDFGCQKITQKIYENIPFMLKNRLKHPPEQVYSLHRKLSGSYLACIRLKARVDCSKIWQEIKYQRIINQVQRELLIKQKVQI